MKNAKKSVVSVVLATQLLTLVPIQSLAAVPFASPTTTTQYVAMSTAPSLLAGIDRYETAAKVANLFGQTDVAVLTAGMDQNLVDATMAAPLAKVYNAPILLTEGNKLNKYTKDALQNQRVKKVFVTSGAVSQNVLNELTTLGIQWEQLGGRDRFETSINIAKKLGSVNKVVVVTAWNNADAMSISSIAAANRMPILISSVNALEPQVADYLKSIKGGITQSYVLGGTVVLSDNIKANLPNAKRLAGKDRYETNLEVLKEFADLKFDNIYITNGTDAHIVDALVAGPLAALRKAPVILSDGGLSNAVKAFLAQKVSSTSAVTGIGGAVSTVALSEIRSIIDNVPVNNPVVYISKAKVEVDSMGMANFSADVDASVTSVELYKGTTKVTDATVAAGKATVTINGGVAAGDVLTIKSYVNGVLKSTDSVTATQAPVAIVYVSNSVAEVDSMGMTNFSADVDASVTSVELYNGTTKVADATVAAGKATVTINSGVAAGDVLTIKSYVNGVLKSTDSVTATQAPVAIVYLSNAVAEVDSMGMANFSADVDASVTGVELYKGTTKVADATVDAGKATAAINSGVAAGDVLTVKSYVNGELKSSDSVTVTPSAQTVYLSNASAQKDINGMIQFDADLDASITSVELYKGNSKVADATIAGGKASAIILSGVDFGEALTVKSYTGNQLLETDTVTVSMKIPPIYFVSNVKAEIDPTGITHFSADVTFPVSALEIFKGGIKLADATIANGKATATITDGVNLNDVLIVKGSLEMTSLTTAVRVQAAQSVVYVSNAVAEVDSMGMTNFSADVDASVTSVELYNGTTKVADATVAVGKATVTINSGVAAGDVLTIQSYVNGVLKSTDSVTATQAPVAIVYVSNAVAEVDSMGMTNFSADVDASVTSVELYNGTIKVADATVAAGKATVTINSGVAAGDALTIKSYVNGELKSTDSVTATQAVVYLTKASAVLDSMGMADFSATIDPSVTSVEIYKGTTKLANATVAAGKATVTINSGVSAGDILTIKSYVNGVLKSTDSVTATQYISNATAVLDSMSMPNFSANVDASVTKVEVYKGTTKLATATIAAGKATAAINSVVAKGTALTVKVYVGTTLKSTITVVAN